MKRRRPVLAWRATFVFYVVLLLTITLTDWANSVLTLQYWLVQAGLITLGVAIFVFVGYRFADLSAQRSVLLAFSVGIFTIIPGVLMSLNPPGEFWSQYFTIGMALGAGSFLGFVFIELANRIREQ